jgi:aspartyl protease family protein
MLLWRDTSAAWWAVMQHILFFALLTLALAVFAPRYLMSPRDNGVVIANATPVTPNSRIVSVPRGQNGHFTVDGLVDGRRISFLVDTGAFAVTLRESDAARFGIHPARRDYTARVTTANGVTSAAPIELNRVEVGDILVRNVRALVLPDESLGQNLLGMTFLSQIHWQYQSGKLVMEQ